MEREQYEWMLDFLLDIYKAHPQEDEIVMQYINVGLSKAGAVIGLVSTMDTYHDKCTVGQLILDT